jgi:undecaprenyl-diphosphatase
VIGAKISDLLTENGPAEGAMLCLLAALIPIAAASVYRERMTEWQAALLRIAGLLATLVVLAVQVAMDGWLVQADQAVTTWMVAHRGIGADTAALTITDTFGPAESACAAILLALGVAIRCRSYLCGLAVAATIGGASALCTITTRLIARPRPPISIHETLETDYSFPSGHVTWTAALFGMLAVTLGLTARVVTRRLLAAFAALVVIAVAASQLYLGAHWLTDVLAGALLGSAAVSLGAPILRWLIARRLAGAPHADHLDQRSPGPIMTAGGRVLTGHRITGARHDRHAHRRPHAEPRGVG